VQRDAVAATALDLADPRGIDIHEPRQSPLGQTTPLPAGSDALAQGQGDRPREAVGVSRLFGAAAADQYRIVHEPHSHFGRFTRH
jgi:hypothetical protein